MDTADLIVRLNEDYLDDTLGLATDDSLATEESLIRYFDEAQKEACRRMDLLYDEETAEACRHTLVAGKRVYPIDSRVTKLERVSYGGVDLPKKVESEYEGLSWRSDTGPPTSFYCRGTSIYLHPVPTATEAGNALSLAVYRTPLDDMTCSDEELEIPAEFHQALIYWALYRVLSKRDEDINDPQGALYYLAKFTNVFGEEVPADVRIHQFESPWVTTLRPATGYQFTNTTESDPDFDASGWN